MNVLGRYRFHVGEIVFHKRFGYRGVVIAADPACRAAGTRALGPKAARNQPWYHLLVHGGRETYVAQDHLVHDWNHDPVEHPEVDLRFPTFHKGRYFYQSTN